MVWFLGSDCIRNDLPALETSEKLILVLLKKHEYFVSAFTVGIKKYSFVRHQLAISVE